MYEWDASGVNAWVSAVNDGWYVIPLDGYAGVRRSARVVLVDGAIIAQIRHCDMITFTREHSTSMVVAIG